LISTIIFRMGVCYPAFQRLASFRKMIVEINTDDGSESWLRMGMFKFLAHRYAQRKLLSRAAGAVCVDTVTAALVRHRGLEVLVLGNSINLAAHSPSPAPAFSEPRLLFLGAEGCVWHGVDKLKVLAERFPRWRIDVVGIGAPDPQERWPNNIIFHGFLPRGEYKALLDAADVAVGALALHRKRMSEAPTLKVREYLAAGVPVIMGHRDCDFFDPVPFILELPNSEANIVEHFAEIEAFVLAWKGRRVERSLVQHLDVSVKERQRLAFIEGKTRTGTAGSAP
jgi:hypothetical protein